MAEENPDLWEGDINEAVVEEWKAETTPFERVQEVIRSTSTPQYASEIGERARVSEPTARTHLKRLVKTGHAETVETGQGTQYKRSRQTIAMSRIVELHRELSREELVDGIKRLRADINDLQNRFDATDPDDLAIQIEDGDAEEAWKAVTEWRSLEENLDIAKAALALYDFDPDTEGDRAAVETASAERGSFADTPPTSGSTGVSRTA
ncbi:MAG: winged helix-turn-helix domain-containing protein [Halobacteriales archaeon]|nr:winged helix-turn-helix domain-containing protein [Halobacteriales archaeon]